MSRSVLIFVSSISKIHIPKELPLVPIQVGCHNAKVHFEGMLHDNDGINISKDNPYYCELTAQYWAWKNTNSDFVGFLHHRRYFSFEENKIRDAACPKRKVRPYFIFDEPNEETLNQISFNTNSLQNMIERYDIIAPTSEKIYETVCHQYERCENPATNEIEIVRKIIAKRFPQYLKAADDYLNGKEAYFCNMFVMRRDVFEDYCEWLFDILFELDACRSEEQRQKRDNGKISERLFGIYFTQKKREGILKWAEVPRIHFALLNGASVNHSFNRLLYRIAPPGSIRRAVLRRL